MSFLAEFILIGELHSLRKKEADRGWGPGCGAARSANYTPFAQCGTVGNIRSKKSTNQAGQHWQMRTIVVEGGDEDEAGRAAGRAAGGRKQGGAGERGRAEGLPSSFELSYEVILEGNWGRVLPENEQLSIANIDWSDGSSGGEMDGEKERKKWLAVGSLSHHFTFAAPIHVKFRRPQLSRSFTASEVEGKVGMVVSDGDGNQLKAVVINSTLSLFGSDCGEDEGKKINQKGNN
ncbi:hypothetical protein K438DRAFT_1784800 [Mycena galopus ATCC 62051]|nr:hypothetical protein K438DRAFT_1784800 [Mycena galopus ATCC 62051]